ncbi:MAG: hypothetical protein PHD76_11960 [Methylacidiphilales bacterium]|nr:hypothetical protein [Candidatus Methylacidiphilales bacterium]
MDQDLPLTAIPDRIEPWGPDSKAAADYGIDLSLILSNLELSPEERLIRNDLALNAMQALGAPSLDEQS